jgi:DNA-directed RNA polymerase alpha subunit
MKISQQTLNALNVAVDEGHSVSNLEQLGLNQRLINLLESNKITKIEHLLYKTKEELLAISNFGEKNLKIIFEALSKYHLVKNYE